ncbi:hemin uptake protein HemP [Piscinibacter sp.]|uniref:hemin uptake protein HemP n=1 Tax=Piscinibacter sp. TaxID=1903157 RepID=UPI0039E3F9FE
MVNPTPLPAAHPSVAPQPAVKPPLRWDSGVLLGAGKEALVEHRGECYRLRLTAQGRLILTK